VIGYRHVDPRLPFLWEGPDQPAGRWHGDGEGPAHYLAETPDGAWAEFLRHEEIDDPQDLATIRRAIWAIEVPDDEPEASPKLTRAVLTGGRDTYEECQAKARRLRARGATRLRAPSAALRPGSSGWRVDGGLRPGRVHAESVVVLFGRRPDLVGWRCAIGAPAADLLGRVRPIGGRAGTRSAGPPGPAVHPMSEPANEAPSAASTTPSSGLRSSFRSRGEQG
jgi:hypothetical protein